MEQFFSAKPIIAQSLWAENGPSVNTGGDCWVHR